MLLCLSDNPFYFLNSFSKYSKHNLEVNYFVFEKNFPGLLRYNWLTTLSLRDKRDDLISTYVVK